MKLKIVNKKRFIISIILLCFILFTCTSVEVSGKSQE